MRGQANCQLFPFFWILVSSCIGHLSRGQETLCARLAVLIQVAVTLECQPISQTRGCSSADWSQA